MFPFFFLTVFDYWKIEGNFDWPGRWKKYGTEFNIITIITYYYEIMHERRGRIIFLTSLQFSILILPILRPFLRSVG